LFIKFCFAAAGYSRKATTVESGKRSKQMAHETPGTPTFYVYIVVIIGLVLFAGLMSGLTLGLMSLGLVDLEVLIKSGTPADKKHAGFHPGALTSSVYLPLSTRGPCPLSYLSLLVLQVTFCVALFSAAIVYSTKVLRGAAPCEKTVP
jgi:hypothetical protein